MTEPRRRAAMLPATEKGIALASELEKALREQARLWNELGDGQHKYELLYHRKPSDRDLEMEVRRQMRGELPETIRWRLALLAGGPLSHE